MKIIWLKEFSNEETEELSAEEQLHIITRSLDSIHYSTSIERSYMFECIGLFGRFVLMNRYTDSFDGWKDLAKVIYVSCCSTNFNKIRLLTTLFLIIVLQNPTSYEVFLSVHTVMWFKHSARIGSTKSVWKRNRLRIGHQYCKLHSY